MLLLRTPSFVCPIEKRVQGSLFFIKTIKTGRNGTVRYVLIVLIKNKEPCTRFSIGQTKEGVRNIKSFDGLFSGKRKMNGSRKSTTQWCKKNRMSTITTRQHEGPRNNATAIANTKHFVVSANNHFQHRQATDTSTC